MGIKNIARKVIKWIDDEQDAENDLPPTANQLRRFLACYPLSQHLPYEAYDEETKVFYNRESLGLLFEVPISTGISEGDYNTFIHLITKVLPEGATCQFLLYASPRIGDALSAMFVSRVGKGEFHEQSALGQTKLLVDGAYPDTSKTGFVVRDFRCFISISLNATSSSSDISIVRDEVKGALSHLYGEKGYLEADPGVLKQLILELTNPCEDMYLESAKYNSLDSISKQSLKADFELKINTRSLAFQSGWEARVMATAQFPKQWALSEMLALVGDVKNGRDKNITCPFFFSYIIHIPSQSIQQIKMRTKLQRWRNLSRGALRTFVPQCGEITSDLETSVKQSSDGNKLVECGFFVGIFALKDKIASHESALISRFSRAREWALEKTSYMTFPLYLSCLPMAADSKCIDDLKKYGYLRRMHARQATQFLPVMGEWKGTKKALYFLTGRAGQLMSFYPYENDDDGGNYNFLITGEPGSGKSMSGQRHAKEVHAIGGIVRIFDRGDSFKKLCEIVDGQLIRIDRGAKLSFNPFTHVNELDPTNATMLINLIARMAGEARAPISKLEQSDLEKAIKQVWIDYGNQGTMDLVIACLNKSLSEEAKIVARKLYSWGSEGKYGGYFNSPSNVNLKNDFVVIELSGLDSFDDLRSVILMSSVHQVREEMMLERTRPKLCIFEEAWKLLDSSEEMAKFMAEGFLTARKHNGSFCVVIQQVEKLFETLAGRTMFSNSSWMLFHKHQAQVINQLIEEGKLVMGDWQKSQYQSLTTSDRYAEVLIKTPSSGLAVARNIMDPFTRLLFSSKGPEYEAIEQLRRQGHSISRAIEIMLEKRGAVA